MFSTQDSHNNYHNFTGTLRICTLLKSSFIHSFNGTLLSAQHVSGTVLPLGSVSEQTDTNPYPVWSVHSDRKERQ